MSEHPHDDQAPAGASRGRWVFWGFLAIAAYFLVTEHRAHALQYLPFAFLLACPLLHLFHGHGGHGRKGREREQGKAAAEKEADTRQRSHGCH